MNCFEVLWFWAFVVSAGPPYSVLLAIGGASQTEPILRVPVISAVVLLLARLHLREKLLECIMGLGGTSILRPVVNR